MTLPGTYERCMSGHYYACTRGDEECPTCNNLSRKEAEIAALIRINLEKDADIAKLTAKASKLDKLFELGMASLGMCAGNRDDLKHEVRSLEFVVKSKDAEIVGLRKALEGVPHSSTCALETSDDCVYDCVGCIQRSSSLRFGPQIPHELQKRQPCDCWKSKVDTALSPSSHAEKEVTTGLTTTPVGD